MGQRHHEIAAIHRFPVKSMGGEQLDEAVVTGQGIVGDRAYALVDEATGQVVSAKDRRFASLLQCRARFTAAPTAGETPPAVITLPDGTSTATDDHEANDVLSRFLGRRVRIAAVAPDDFTIDQFHPDVDGVHPAGYRNTVAPQKLGASFFAEIGLPSPVPVGSFLDLFPMSLITSATLAELGRRRPESRFDARRFRMNVVVRTEGEGQGFLDNEWVGRTASLGDAVETTVVMPDPRCVMVTAAQDGLDADLEILRTLTRHNRIDAAPGRPFPCAGVYAVVRVGGTVHAGDPVTLR